MQTAINKANITLPGKSNTLPLSALVAAPLSSKKMNEVWYQMVRANGVKMGDVDRVKLSNGSKIVDFRDAVKEKNGDGLLKGISPAQLKVYSNSAAFIRQTEGPLKNSVAVTGVGLDEDNPLYVEVEFEKLQKTEMLLIEQQTAHLKIKEKENFQGTGFALKFSSQY
jgi:hypothetical protein